MLQVGSLQPPDYDIGILFPIICKSNDPQIFHLQKKLFTRLSACFGTISEVHPSVCSLCFVCNMTSSSSSMPGLELAVILEI